MASNRLNIKIIRRSADFQRLSKARRQIVLTPWLVAKVLKNPEETRVGWSLPRSVGGAVVRNKLKRWVRIYLNENVETVNDAKHDVSLIFRCKSGQDLKELSHKELDFELERLFKILSKS